MNTAPDGESRPAFALLQWLIGTNADEAGQMDQMNFLRSETTALIVCVSTSTKATGEVNEQTPASGR